MAQYYAKRVFEDRASFYHSRRDAGYLSIDPTTAIKRCVRGFEAWWQREHSGMPPEGREGKVYALWSFPDKVTPTEALRYANTTAPDVLQVIIWGPTWKMVRLDPAYLPSVTPRF